MAEVNANTLKSQQYRAKKEEQTHRAMLADQMTNMPCNYCAKMRNCDAECASFRTWSEYGV